MNRFVIFTVLTITSLIFGFPEFSQADPYYKNSPLQRLEPANVLVMVESYDGWGHEKKSAFSCDGRFVLLGAYGDTTRIRKAVPPEVSLDLVNQLLVMDFFALAAEFPPTTRELKFNDDDRLNFFYTEAIDGGFFKITLFLGEKSHTVSLVGPAYGAPQKLRDWKILYKSLVKEQLDW